MTAPRSSVPKEWLHTERKKELERKGDRFPVCDKCFDGAYMSFPYTCSCGRGR